MWRDRTSRWCTGGRRGGRSVFLTSPQELVRLPVDVLVAVSPSAVRAASNATTTLPIVAHDLETDPVASGRVASLARPGGNLTGVFFDFADFAGKWVELLKEVMPQLAHVAVLWDPRTGLVQLRAVEAAAQTLGVQLHILEVQAPDDIEGACRTAAAGHAGALLALSAPLVNAHQKRIADCALGNQLPAMMLFTGFAGHGGLMAYGPNLPATYRQHGVFVSKILQGAKPEGLPVERPRKLELAINLKTAQALGITIPRRLLVLADEVMHITTGQEAYQNHRLRNRPGPVLGATPPIGLLNGLRPRENNTDQI